MNLALSIPTRTNNFAAFVIHEKSNRFILILTAGLMVVQLGIFKWLYPYPDFFSDSYSYIYAAQANLDISIWPIGYSKFLRWFHSVTASDTALVVFQYILLELAALYFYASVLYLLRPGKTARVVLYIFLFLNPLFLYISNYVNSDPLFAALSFSWFAQLLWIITRPARYQWVLHALLLFCCFTVRNNAYYYPFISALAFGLSRQRLRLKLAGIISPLLLLVPFIIHSRNAAFKMTGTHQFSLFTGWQLANNALYMYEYANIDTAAFPSAAAREVNRYSAYFYSRVQKDFRENYLKGYVGNFFIREPFSPLKTYFEMNYPAATDSAQTVAWGKASALYGEFASTLIKKNIGAYLWEFAGVNLRHYILPPLEKLELYNLGEDSVGHKVVNWFHYPSAKVYAASATVQGKILKIFPPLFFFLNAYVLGCLLVLFLQGKLPALPAAVQRIGLLSVAFAVANFLFLVLSTIIVFRYEFFPMTVLLLLALLLTEHMQTNAATLKNKVEYA
jgi:hypothetical protein